MSPAPAGRRCAVTNLHLIPAGATTAFRVAKDRYGALSARRNTSLLDGPAPDLRGRYDTTGSTLYFADSRQCAYGEVLTGFRKQRGALAADARAAGYELSEWVEVVTSQAIGNGLDTPWAISCDWQMARSIYSVELPADGWWVRIDHSDTLNALVDQYPHRQLRNNPLLTLADVAGEDRALTTVLAEHVRNLLLDDGSEALGITFPSKTGYAADHAHASPRHGQAPGELVGKVRVDSDDGQQDARTRHPAIGTPGELGRPLGSRPRRGRAFRTAVRAAPQVTLARMS